jgi:hypothetical protein
MATAGLKLALIGDIRRGPGAATDSANGNRYCAVYLRDGFPPGEADAVARDRSERSGRGPARMGAPRQEEWAVAWAVAAGRAHGGASARCSNITLAHAGAPVWVR